MKGSRSIIRDITRITKWATIALIIAAVLALAYVLDPFDQSQGQLISQFKSFLRFVPYPFTVFVLFIAIGSLALIPINLLLITAALIFPGWKGFFCGLLGAMLASFLEYLVGRYLIDGDFLENKLGEKFRSIRKRISENGLAAMTFLSLVPVAPHIVNNFIAGVCRVRILHLLIGTMIGFIPGLLVINILGRSIRRFIADPNLITAGLVAAVLIVMCLIAQLIRMHFARKHRNHDIHSAH